MAMTDQEIIDWVNRQARVGAILESVQQPGADPLRAAIDLLVAASVLIQGVTTLDGSRGLSGLDADNFARADDLARRLRAEIAVRNAEGVPHE